MGRARQWLIFAAFLCTLYTGSATTPSHRQKAMEIRKQLLPLLSKMNGKPKDMHIKAVTVTKVERTHKLPIGADGKPSIAAINELVHAIEKNQNQQNVQPPKSSNTAHMDKTRVSNLNSRTKSMYAELISKMTADVQAALRSSQSSAPSRRGLHSNAERTMSRRERIHPDMHSERRSFRTRSSDFSTGLPHENIGSLSLSRSRSTPRDRWVSTRHSNLGNVERLLDVPYDVRDRFGSRYSNLGSDVRDILGSHSSSLLRTESLNYPLEMPQSLGHLGGLDSLGSLSLLDSLPDLASLTLPSAATPVLGELTRIPNQGIMPNPLSNYRERSTYSRQLGGAQTVSNPRNIQHISIQTDGQSQPLIHTSGSGSGQSLSTNHQASSYVHTMPHNPIQSSFNPPPPSNSIQSLQIYPMSANSGQHRQHQSTQSMSNRQETFLRSQTHPSSSAIGHQRFPQQQLLPVLQPATHGHHIAQPTITHQEQSNSKPAHVSVNVQPSKNPVNLHLAVNSNTAPYTQHNRATNPSSNNVFLAKATSTNNGFPEKMEIIAPINSQVGGPPQVAPSVPNVIAPIATNGVAPRIKSIDLLTGTMMEAQNPLQNLGGPSPNQPVVIKVGKMHLGNQVMPAPPALPVLQAPPAPAVQQSPQVPVQQSMKHSKCVVFCMK